MAGTITHSYFIMDVYDRLSIKSKELLIEEKENLKVFAQNTDCLFFYNLVSLKKGKNIRKFGYYAQKEKAYLFFSTLINYIKCNNKQYDSKNIAFLYGMLSHYILDSTIHPLIIYKTGSFNSHKKSTYKYNQLHGEFESYIDNYFISIKENMDPYKFRCDKCCFNLTSSDSLIDTIDFVYKEVYDIKDYHKYYYKSIKQMKAFYRIFRYDRTGIKRNFYTFVDLLMPKCIYRTVPLSYRIKNMKDKMNLDNKEWVYPTDKKIKSNLSILDLYNKALDTCVNTIKEINNYLYYDKNIDLFKVIKNYNYSTGLDSDIKKEPKYFEF